MPEPMYRQIADDLRRKIESGELAPEDRLPTETGLMERYSASRNTVRDAVKLLTTRHLVETRPGQGTYVIEKAIPFVTTLTGNPATGYLPVRVGRENSETRAPVSRDLRVEIQGADDIVARSLQIEPGAQVVSRHQRRFIDGAPWSLQTSFYPMRLVREGAERLLEARLIAGGAAGYLAGTCGIKQAGYRDSIGVRVPDSTETRFFELPASGHVSVVEIHRIAFDADGNRIRLTVSVYPADRNRFRVNVGSVPAEAIVGPPGPTPA